MRLIKILIAAALLAISCSTTRRKPLHFKQTDYLGNDLRLDGFYYSNKYCVFYFYRNGVIYGGYYASRFKDLIMDWNYLIQKRTNVNQTPMNWGIFEITYPEIKLEYWHSGDSGAPYPNSQYTGKILNDTTLLLTGGSFETDTFHFHAMPIKPDSTNRFLK